MIKEPKVSLFSMAMCLSNAMDLVSPALVDHHKRVAYIALCMASEMGMSLHEQNNLMLAALLHDSGALSLAERIDTLNFETLHSREHAERGYHLLRSFSPFAEIANIIRYHHTPCGEGGSLPLSSGLLHLADRAAVLMKKQPDILSQVRDICEKIQEHSGKLFLPELVNVFRALGAREHFWLDAVSPSINSILFHRSNLPSVEMRPAELLGLGMIFCQIIDFRSRFTSTHSRGVAAGAEALASLAGFSKRECEMMRMAGFLHDLGKLAVPTEILEKPAALTKEEFNIVRRHTYYTYRILESVNDFEVINTWAAFHHERLDGRGYPFHHKACDLSLGSRIMAVADVFTAITEDRPYRKGMTLDEAFEVLQKMADSSGLDSGVVAILKHNPEEVNSKRKSAQEAALKEYLEFMK